MRRVIVMTTIVAGTAGACGSDEGAPCRDEAGRVELSVGVHVVDASTRVRVLPITPTRILVRNVGAGAACLRDLALEADVGGGLSLASDPWPSADAPVGLAPGEAHLLEVAYDPTLGAPANARGIVRLVAGEATHAVHVQGATTALVAVPGELDFGFVMPGIRRSLALTLHNVGPLPVRVTRVHLDGPASFAVVVHGALHRASTATSRDGVAVSPPLEIAPGASAPLEVEHGSEALSPEHGNLRIVTDELPVAPGLDVALYANLPVPCLTVSPPALDFGGQAVGQVTTRSVELASCGPRDVVIADVALAGSAGGRFTLAEGAAAPPVVIPEGGRHVVQVSYAPTALLDGGEADQGALVITSNLPSGATRVPLTGFGSDGRCPTARVACDAGEVVRPPATVRCQGGSSTTVGGEPIASWQWTAEGPDGRPLGLRQRGTPDAVELDLFTPGAYRIGLAVWDGAGLRSCNTAVRELLVGDDAGLRVALTWRTPGDVDETDTGVALGGMSVGSDLDLHLLHEDGADYFDERGDTYWLSPSPSWSGSGPDYSPVMLRDDTDGGGPEIIVARRPVEGRTYTVGVHYWDDWGYGPALATLRVWVRGDLVYEWDEVALVTQDMWHALTIDWPSGAVHGLGDGAPVIVPNYPVPLASGLPE